MRMRAPAQPCGPLDGSPSVCAYFGLYAAWYAVLAVLAAVLGAFVAVAERPAVAVVAGGGRGARRDATLRRNAGSAPPPKLQEALSPIVATRRLAALILLLEGLHELRDTLRSGDGDNRGASGLLLRPHEPSCRIHRDGRTCSCVQSGVDELERLLGLMRREEPWLRWHVVAWFVDARRHGRWEPRPRAQRKRPWSPYVYRRLVDRNPAASRERALEGVAWLAERWRLRDVRGELVEPWLVAPGVDRRSFERLASAYSGPVRPNPG